MKFIINLILGLLVSSLAFGATTESRVEKEFDMSSIKKLVVESKSGLVQIKTHVKKNANIVVEKTDFEKFCNLHMESKGEELRIVVEDSSFIGNGKCSANFNIEVPEKVSVDLSNGAGNLEITGTLRDVNFTTGSGNATINGESSSVQGRTGSGSITAKGTTQKANYRVGSGNVKLAYEKLKNRSDIDVRTGSGNVEVLLPKTAKVQTKFNAGSGHLYNEFGQATEKANVYISMNSGSGGLTVKKID